MSRLHRSVALLGCIAVSGCVDAIPTTPIVASRATSARLAGLGRPTLVPNHVKYSDAGKRPAKARSGNASLVAEALIGSNGLTTLDVTAGITGEPPSGTLARIQIKEFDANGSLARVSNHSALNGSTSRFTLAGRAHGDELQIRAVITAVDGSSEVVTVSETVKYRPDIVVTAMSVEPQSVRGALIVIGAQYQEMRGDKGAQMSCVLRVNGVALDRVPEMWVDAGSLVGCQFLYRFPANGVHEVSVSAEGVEPGDYDLSNNTRSAAITIVDPAPVPASNQFSWDANLFAAINRHGTAFGDGWARNSVTGEGSEYRNFFEWKGQDQFFIDMSGQTARSLNGPIDVTFTDRVDDVVLHDDRFIPGTDQRSTFESGPFRQDCSLLFRTQEVPGDVAPFQMFIGQLIVCTSRNIEPAQELGTWFTYFAQGGHALYFSDQFSRSFGPEFENTFVFVGDVDYLFGTYAVGSTFGFDISFSDGTQTLVASGSIPIWVRDVHEQRPYSCSDSKFENWTFHNCEQHDMTSRQYRAIGVAPVP
jgi:hypothetical protein